jgi:hypothetical protein
METDIFIYFSHYRVSIPPSNYINACHQFGVHCLGTFITENDDGILENAILCQDPELYAE